MSERDRAEIVFPMVKDVRGWPPVRAEHVWAERCGEDLFRVENAPFFVRDLAVGDLVRAVPSALETGPVFVERVAWSGNCTIRVMPLRNGELADDDVGLVVDAFKALGIQSETAGVYPIVSLCVPMDADLAAVKALIEQGQRDGRWEWEEGCVGQVWLDL